MQLNLDKLMEIFIVALEVKACDPLVPTAACDSMPIAEVHRAIPGTQYLIWIVRYKFFEFE